MDRSVGKAGRRTDASSAPAGAAVHRRERDEQGEEHTVRLADRGLLGSRAGLSQRMPDPRPPGKRPMPSDDYPGGRGADGRHHRADRRNERGLVGRHHFDAVTSARTPSGDGPHGLEVVYRSSAAIAARGTFKGATTRCRSRPVHWSGEKGVDGWRP